MPYHTGNFHGLHSWSSDLIKIFSWVKSWIKLGNWQRHSRSTLSFKCDQDCWSIFLFGNNQFFLLMSLGSMSLIRAWSSLLKLFVSCLTNRKLTGEKRESVSNILEGPYIRVTATSNVRIEVDVTMYRK